VHWTGPVYQSQSCPTAVSPVHSHSYQVLQFLPLVTPQSHKFHSRSCFRFCRTCFVITSLFKLLHLLCFSIQLMLFSDSTRRSLSVGRVVVAQCSPLGRQKMLKIKRRCLSVPTPVLCSHASFQSVCQNTKESCLLDSYTRYTYTRIPLKTRTVVL